MGSWNTPGNPVNSAPPELNILLVGPSRMGKSSVGNTLLGRGKVFDTNGGRASTAATSIIDGRHMTVVDAQGWSSTEDSVPREEKIELLRALDLFGSGGPHVILLVIPLLDFTESERRAVEKRMEFLTSGVWRHTMILFTFGDRLKGRGQSIEQHIETAGPALKWLMEKCRYRCYVLDNKREEKPEEERKGGKKREEGAGRTEVEKGAERVNKRRDAHGRWEGGQGQVRGLVSKVEDMLQENGGWHFSFHMYQRLEEEWIRREQELRARMEAEREEERARWKCKTEERKVKTEAESIQRLRTEGEEEDSQRKEQEKEGMEEKVLGNSLERWINLEGEKEKRIKVEIRRQCSEEKDSEEEECDMGSDSGGEREESGEVKAEMIVPCWPNGGQRLVFSPIRRRS